MSQFSLGIAALQQNLGIFAFAGGEYLGAMLLFAIGVYVVWLYDISANGFKIFDVLLKVMVAFIVFPLFSGSGGADQEFGKFALG